MDKAAVTENELIEKARGERVTLADVEANIAEEHYFNAGAAIFPAEPNESLKCLTFCVLVLQSGYTVTGQSACADPANYNEDIGRRLARAHAVNQIWPLMGYELKSRIHRDQQMVMSSLVPPQADFETYIGTKVVNAYPCNRYQYNELRCWELPANENGDDDGYVVEYTDRIENPPHVSGFRGYVSWSPKDVFERAYRPVRKAEAQPSAASAEGSDQASMTGVTWQGRLAKEYEEVSDRYEKLESFTKTEAFHALPDLDRRDLYQQVNHMEGYKHVLARRLARSQVDA